MYVLEFSVVLFDFIMVMSDNTLFTYVETRYRFISVLNSDVFVKFSQ